MKSLFDKVLSSFILALICLTACGMSAAAQDAGALWQQLVQAPFDP
jgi:hypothetical protein